ncbi:hypothetical protein FZEAL_9324 [Fusarium zealandicum]|uniref:Uncharacterized protein n=1 Tax=Fusarium zealandicum TaxID=1053134 RepID=A0A8H4UBQ3_9HYPO|nr:hypothetical protein FZEAL_9324 [Fusarium zealandicum]
MAPITHSQAKFSNLAKGQSLRGLDNQRLDFSNTEPLQNAYSSLTKTFGPSQNIRTTPITRGGRGNSNTITSRATHSLHRRTSSPEIIGVTIGLVLLVTLLGAGLYLWSWKKTQTNVRKKVHKSRKRRERQQYRRARWYRTRTRTSRQRSSHETPLEDYTVYNMSEPEHRHRSHCGHSSHHGQHGSGYDHHHIHLPSDFTGRRRQDHPLNVADGWVPQRPEPALDLPNVWARYRESRSEPPNEMDAPQIHTAYGTDDGLDSMKWKMGYVFNQRGQRGGIVNCPKHGPMPDHDGR